MYRYSYMSIQNLHLSSCFRALLKLFERKTYQSKEQAHHLLQFLLFMELFKFKTLNLNFLTNLILNLILHLPISIHFKFKYCFQSNFNHNLNPFTLMRLECQSNSLLLLHRNLILFFLRFTFRFS